MGNLGIWCINSLQKLILEDFSFQIWTIWKLLYTSILIYSISILKNGLRKWSKFHVINLYSYNINNRNKKIKNVKNIYDNESVRQQNDR